VLRAVPNALRHATEARSLRAYPRAGEFFELKRRLDPTNKLRNELFNKYDHPLESHP